MDLRIVKTRKYIKETFLQFRSKQPLEKIRVTELCRMASINKTTFYSHYRNIYILSDEIENETISGIIADFKEIDSLFTNPEGFIEGLLESCTARKDVVLTLFSDRMNILVEKMENELKSHYVSPDHSPEKDILMSFLIGGATHVLIKPRYDNDFLKKTLSDIITRIHDRG